MFDLIYGTPEIFDIIKKKYSEAVYKDATDSIHEDRFEVEIPNGKEDLDDEYIKYAVQEGFAGNSFSIQLMLGHKDYTERLKNIIKELGL